MLLPKYSNLVKQPNQASANDLNAYYYDQHARKSSSKLQLSVSQQDQLSFSGRKSIEKLDVNHHNQPQERNMYFQNLLIGDSPIKKNDYGISVKGKTVQHSFGSKEAIVDASNDSENLIKTMMNFNKKNINVLKQGNKIRYRSQLIQPQTLSHLMYQTPSEKHLIDLSPNKQQRYNKSTSDLTDQIPLLQHSSTKQQLAQQPQPSPPQFKSAVSNHFLVPKKISSQVTLKTIINLNHGQSDRKGTSNFDRGTDILPKELTHEEQTERNVVYVKDRFIDTRESAKRAKQMNGMNNSNSIVLDSAQQQNAHLSTAHNTTNKYSSSKKLFQDSSAEEGIQIGQFRQAQNHSLQTQQLQIQQLQQERQWQQQLQQQKEIQQLQTSPSLQTKTITIIKKPSSRHQPSRKKFTTITQYSSQSKLSAPSTPIGYNQIGDFPQNRGNSQGKQSEDIRPFSNGSSTFKRVGTNNSQLSSRQQCETMMNTQQSRINSQQQIQNDAMISKALTGHSYQTKYSSQMSNMKPQIASQSSMNQLINIHDPLVHAVKNLNYDQSNFLQRSLNQIGDVFPKGQGLSVQSLTNHVSQTLMDHCRSKKLNTERLKSSTHLFSDPRENVQSMKSIKRITFNIDKSDSDIDEVEDQQPKKSISFKNIPDYERESELVASPNLKYEIKNFDGVHQGLVDEVSMHDKEDGEESLQQHSSRRDINNSKLIANNLLYSNSSRQQQDNLSNISEGESENQQTEDLKVNIELVNKNQNGINIEKELLEHKIKMQRNNTNKVQELISTIQNNALENHNNKSRMQRSNTFNFLKQKSKIIEEKKIQKKKQFEQNLQFIKEKNSYKDQQLENLELEFNTGGKFNQNNYQHLRINKMARRNKEQLMDAFRKAVKLVQKLKIKSGDIIDANMFSSKPFQKEKSQEFFACVKANNVEQVSFLLRNDKFLVYEYDYLFMTPLHWSCKRGLLKMTELLMRNNAYIEAEDMIGRTPLYFAIERNYEEVIESLLVNKASPYKTKYVDYAATAKTYVVSKMLSVCRRLHWAIKLNPKANKEEQWKKEIAGLLTIRQQQQYLEDEEIKKKELGLY